MNDGDRKKSDCLKSPDTIGQDSSLGSNGDDNVPLPLGEQQTPSGNTLINNNNTIVNNNNVRAGATVDETLPLLQRVEELNEDGTTISNSKKKTHKPKKKKCETVKGASNNNNNNNTTCSSGTASSLTFEQPSFPLFCKRCLGNNVGKKGERSDVFVITCSKCGAHEVLLKPDGSGVVKMSEADPDRKEDLPTGNLMEAVWKNAGDKIRSALREDYREVMEARKQRETRIQTFAHRLQACSRQCADLYPLIVTLRSLQLKKTSSAPQQRKNIETQLKSRLSALEDGIQEVESFEAKYLRKLFAAHVGAGINPEALAAAAESFGLKIPPEQILSLDDATSPETKEATPQSNSSLFDPPPPSTAVSPTSAPPSTSVSIQTPTVMLAQASGGATATGSTSDSAGIASTKTKSSISYIERVEKLTPRLDMMHAKLTKYCLLQSVVSKKGSEEAKAKTKRTEEQAVSSLYNFTQGLVDHCKGTTRTCMQKLESKKKDIRKKERLLAELRTMGEKFIAEGDEEGVQQIQEMLQQINLEN